MLQITLPLADGPGISIKKHAMAKFLRTSPSNNFRLTHMGALYVAGRAPRRRPSRNRGNSNTVMKDVNVTVAVAPRFPWLKHRYLEIQ